MLTLKLLKSGTLIALALLSLGSHAAPTGSVRAELSGFNIELIDLDPNDGIVPDLTVNNRSWSSHASYLGKSEMNARVFNAGNTQVSNGYGSAFGTTGMEALWSHTHIQGVPPQGERIHAFRTESDYSTNFTLTPHTALRLSATGQLSTTKTDGVDIFAHASLLASWFGADWQSAGQEFSTREEGLRDFRLSAFLYTHDEAATGSFQFRTVAGTTIFAQPMAPVPEPSSYAMLLAGAAALLVMQRRARRT